jgi:hypothetical protein
MSELRSALMSRWNRSVSRMKMPPTLRFTISAERRRLIRGGSFSIRASQTRMFLRWFESLRICHSSVISTLPERRT